MIPGVIRTRVGYAGGTTKNPTYRNIGDHSETTQIDFDPTQISYKQILEKFWTTHNPCRAAYSTQYRSAIFYHNDEQKKIALETLKEQEGARGKIHTAIAPATEFYLAEDYHQKYALRNSAELIEEFERIYPDLNSFVNSTAAARVNGYIHGEGTLAAFEAEAASLGLSKEGIKNLRRYIR